MALTDNGRTRLTARRRLRRETPSTVAVLAGEREFAAMRAYDTFTFDDHAGYLRHVEGLLRSLAAGGTYTTVALFDPDRYARYCADLHLDPDSPDSRTRYTAHVAATGTTLPYDGRPLAGLLPDLLDAAGHRAHWERATALLSRNGDCTSCGEDIGRAAFTRASHLLHRLVATAGPGRHHLVCSVSPGPGDPTTPGERGPLVAVLHTEHDGHRPPHLGEAAALVFCTVLGAGIATDGAGGVVLRTTAPGRPETVRAWSLTGTGLRPLSEAEVFAAYCTDARTGEPVPPEHGVEYKEGFPVD
ncbi:hypothetical protein [Streptomyces sp. NPDC049585]|uniref:hypothetical protein n=1 Tax=Streptomyces sp. NPDC049585 TaxID=3155154 RepID=UPI0034131890